MPNQPKYATIAKLAKSLPGVHESYFHGPWFKVGKKGFALYWNSTESWIFKLPHDQQMMLFEACPETFSPMQSGRLLWSYVEVGNLSTAELRDFLVAAWRNVAPKRMHAALPAASASGCGTIAKRKRDRRRKQDKPRAAR